jgi:hypothetical protein
LSNSRRSIRAAVDAGFARRPYVRRPSAVLATARLGTAKFARMELTGTAQVARVLADRREQLLREGLPGDLAGVAVRHPCGQFLLFFRAESGSAPPASVPAQLVRIRKRLSVFSFVALDIWGRGRSVR